MTRNRGTHAVWLLNPTVSKYCYPLYMVILNSFKILLSLLCGFVTPQFQNHDKIKKTHSKIKRTHTEQRKPQQNKEKPRQNKENSLQDKESSFLGWYRYDPDQSVGFFCLFLIIPALAN